MPNPKDTEPASEKQPKNKYSRVPDELWPKLVHLTSFEAKLFLLLNSKANRKRTPLGLVDANISAIALLWMDTSRGSVRRGLKRLDSLDLIDWVPRAVSGGSIRVRHLVGADHEDPYVDHHDPFLDHHDPPTASNPNKTLPLTDHRNGDVSENVNRSL